MGSVTEPASASYPKGRVAWRVGYSLKVANITVYG